MYDLTLLTNDSYYRLGFESLFKTKHRQGDENLLIMDDGIQFLYFLSMKESKTGLTLNVNIPAGEFISRLKLAVPRNTTPGHLRHVIRSFHSGRYQHRRLTPAAYRVLLDIATGVPGNISRAKLQLKHKCWYNLKGNAFVKLGIKNTVVFMRAIHVWHSFYHQLRQSPRACASDLAEMIPFADVSTDLPTSCLPWADPEPGNYGPTSAEEYYSVTNE